LWRHEDGYDAVIGCQYFSLSQHAKDNLAQFAASGRRKALHLAMPLGFGVEEHIVILIGDRQIQTQVLFLHHVDGEFPDETVALAYRQPEQ